MGESVSKQEFTTFNEMHHDDNLRFYKNKLRARPTGETIMEMLKWKGDYTMLEVMHCHIQWLFPIPGSSGRNEFAKPLLDHEAQAIKENEKLKARVLAAYTMMLDFYGMELCNVDTGEVKRANHWKTRYGYLNSSERDWYRISRILTSLGELGFEHFQAPLVEFIIYEATVHLDLPDLHIELVEHWIGIVKDKLKQGELFSLLADSIAQLEGANAGIFKDAKSNAQLEGAEDRKPTKNSETDENVDAVGGRKQRQENGDGVDGNKSKKNKTNKNEDRKPTKNPETEENGDAVGGRKQRQENSDD